MRLLVTGTGRCGTWWLTHALRSCGIDAQHEVAYSTNRHGTGDWSCEVSWLAAPFTPAPSNVYVVHLVRHPLATIRSRAAWGSFEDDVQPIAKYNPRPKGRWALQRCPEIAEGSTPIERAAIHWVRWNQLVQAPDEILRFEDCDELTVERLARIVDPDARSATLPTNKVNASRSTAPVLEWADVDHVHGVLELADAYGYLGGTCVS